MLASQAPPQTKPFIQFISTAFFSQEMRLKSRQFVFATITNTIL
jgi:hypothetical protein